MPEPIRITIRKGDGSEIVIENVVSYVLYAEATDGVGAVIDHCCSHGQFLPRLIGHCESLKEVLRGRAREQGTSRGSGVLAG